MPGASTNVSTGILLYESACLELVSTISKDVPRAYGTCICCLNRLKCYRRHDHYNHLDGLWSIRVQAATVVEVHLSGVFLHWKQYWERIGWSHCPIKDQRWRRCQNLANYVKEYSTVADRNLECTFRDARQASYFNFNYDPELIWFNVIEPVLDETIQSILEPTVSEPQMCRLVQTKSLVHIIVQAVLFNRILNIQLQKLCTS